MKSFVPLLALCFSDLALAACPPLQMFAARGTGESPTGEGIFADAQGISGLITSEVILRVPGAVTNGVPYPAIINAYQASEGAGVGNLTLLLENFNAECPDSKIALVGMSQGAQVVVDTICGRNSTTFSVIPPIDPIYTANVVAIVAAADPGNTLGMPGVTKFGDSTRNGGFVRLNFNSCSGYAGRLGSWCDSGDAFCDRGTSFAVHAQTIPVNEVAMVDWVVSHYYAAIGETEPPQTLSATGSTTVSVPVTTSVAPVTTSALYSNSTTSAPTGLGGSITATATNGTIPSATSAAATSAIVTAAAAPRVDAKWMAGAGVAAVAALAWM